MTYHTPLKVRIKNFREDYPIASVVAACSSVIVGIVAIDYVVGKHQQQTLTNKRLRVDLARHEMFGVREGLDWELYCEERKLSEQRNFERHEMELSLLGGDKGGKK